MINKRLVSALSLFVTLLFSMTHAAAQSEPGSGGGFVLSSSSSRAMTTRFIYTATVSSIPSGVKGVDLWIPVPSNSMWQTVSDLSVSAPVRYRLTREHTYGDRMVYAHFDHPTAPLAVAIGFTVARREVRVLERGAAGFDRKSNAHLTSLGLAPDARVPVGGRFLTIAEDAAAGKSTPEEKERALFDNVIATMKYDYKKESPRYAQGDSLFICDWKSGNCSDLHSYLISLSRSIGIPAILEFGFPLTGIPVPSPLPIDGKVSGYHCWTWFQDGDRGWAPLDAADGRRWLDSGRADVKNYLFGNLVLERSAVAISRGRDIVLEPAQKSGPLNYFIYPYAEGDGQPIAAKWDIHYHVLQAPK